jgi:VanZ family protein
MNVLRSWGPVVGYAGLIFYLSAQPHPEETLPSIIKHFSDKVLHVIEYSVLGALCYRAIYEGHGEAWRKRAILAAVMLTSLYGASDEVHQAFVPFRESSVYDWVADTVGATLGAISMRRILEFWTARSLPEVLREP